LKVREHSNRALAWGSPLPVVSSAFVILAVLACTPTPSQAETLQAINGLASHDERLRFDAALELIGSSEAAVDDRVTRALTRRHFVDSPTALAAAAFVLWKRSGEPFPASEIETPRPDIVLISVDTLRQDRLGCYGYERPTSPAIDALAARGAHFRNAFSPTPWTLPTHMSIFTSLYPSFHKLERGGRTGNIRLDYSETTLPQLLQAEGYSTAAFVAHPFLAAAWGFDRGFDRFERHDADASEQSGHAVAWIEWRRFHSIREIGPSSYFLFLHYIDPHEPYAPPERYREMFAGGYTGELKPEDQLVSLYSNRPFGTPEDARFVQGLYDGEVRYVDDELARVFDAVRTTGGEDSTVFVLTSDHGEEFRDHHGMGHKHSLYPEALRVPLIVVDPRTIAAGPQIETPVSILDILPTLTSLTGIVAPANVQGLSMLLWVKRNQISPPTPSSSTRYLFGELGPLGVAWERDFSKRSIRSERYNLILTFDADGTIRKELYDWRDDPAEKREIYSERREDDDVRDLERRLDTFIREGLAYRPEVIESNRIPLDQGLLDRLRALGYVE
jgi:arylsulfatase A-like enzyme